VADALNDIHEGKSKSVSDSHNNDELSHNQTGDMPLPLLAVFIVLVLAASQIYSGCRC
jgi:hypothetical protein